MEIRVFADRQTSAAAAAHQAADVIRRAIAQNNQARVVAATAASQKEFLENLTQSQGIDWERVEAFHLDEYIGLSMSHPGSFRGMFLEQFIRKTGISNFHLLNGDGDVAEVLQHANHAIASAPVDIAFIGIGENGHLAFNDPPADFESDAPYRTVELDAACRRQQVGEGWFPDLSAVPERAISMSIRQILKSRELVAVVPGRNKAQAIELCFNGPITPMAPASILRSHPHATIYLDRESASRLDSNRLDATIRVLQQM